MAFSNDIAIESLALGVINRSLPKAEWTHAGHFALALWLSRYRTDLTAPDAIRAIITGYNDSTGTANTDTAGYHHTITLASMRAAAAHLAGYCPATPLHVVLGTLLASSFGRSDWLLAYWRQETLFSVAARRDWLPPDRAELPF